MTEDGHSLFVNSFAGKARGENTKKAIKQYMGKWIQDQNIFVVDDRKKKWIICNEQKLDIMVDDRYDILENIEANFKKANLQCPTLIWFSDEERHTKYIQVSSWKKLYSTVKNLHRQHKYTFKTV